MDKLTDEEQLRSGMMLETVTEVFLGMVMPAFKLVRGEMGDQPREKQCEAFHNKVRETTKGKHLLNLAYVKQTMVHETSMMEAMLK